MLQVLLLWELGSEVFLCVKIITLLCLRFGGGENEE